MEFLEKYVIYIALALMIGIIVAVICIPKKSYTTREIAIASACIAASFALSFIKAKMGANGGSITIAAIIPLAVYCYFAGILKGLFAALIFATLQFFQGLEIHSATQVIIDYFLAYTVFGIMAALKPLRQKLRGHDFTIMLVVAYVLRFMCHFIIGALPYPQGWEAGWLGSFIYQATYVPADMLIAVAVLIALIQTKTLHRLETLYHQPPTRPTAPRNDTPSE